MNLLMAILIGVLYAVGAYLLMRRSIVKLIFGLLILSNATNLFLFMSGRLVRHSPPLIADGEQSMRGAYADPLVQALILTAIVISFGVLSFLMVLVKRTYQELGDDDLDNLSAEDAR